MGNAATWASANPAIGVDVGRYRRRFALIALFATPNPIFSDRYWVGLAVAPFCNIESAELSQSVAEPLVRFRGVSQSETFDLMGISN